MGMIRLYVTGGYGTYRQTDTTPLRAMLEMREWIYPLLIETKRNKSVVLCRRRSATESVTALFEMCDISILFSKYI